METLCPKCKKKYVVADALTGKQVRCKNDSCKQVFTIAANGTDKPEPAPEPVIVLSPALEDALLPNLPDLSSLSLDDFPQGESPAAAPANFAAPRPKKKSKLASPAALKLGGATIAALAVVALLVLLVINLLGGSGVPTWASYYIPENAQMIAYANIDKLRTSDLFAEFRQVVDKQAMQMEGEFGMDDVSEVFAAGGGNSSNDDPLVVFRLKKDRPLKDFLPKPLREQATQTYKSAEYVSVGGPSAGKDKVFAKTGDCTFCIVSGEDNFKKAVDRLDRKERAKISDNLRTALGAVAGGNLYVAAVNLRPAGPMPFAVDMLSVRAWITSSVQVELNVVFGDANSAKACKTKFDALIAMLKAAPVSNESKEMESLLSGVSMRQNGKKLSCDLKWRKQDVLALVKKAKESGRPF